MTTARVVDVTVIVIHLTDIVIATTVIWITLVDPSFHPCHLGSSSSRPTYYVVVSFHSSACNFERRFPSSFTSIEIGLIGIFSIEINIVST